MVQGVEGSNPFSHPTFSQRNQSLKRSDPSNRTGTDPFGQPFIIGVLFRIGSIFSRNPCTFSMPGQRPAIEYFVQKRRHRTDVGVGISERRFDAPVAKMMRQLGGIGGVAFHLVSQVAIVWRRSWTRRSLRPILFRAVSNALSIVRMASPPRYRELRTGSGVERERTPTYIRQLIFSAHGSRPI